MRFTMTVFVLLFGSLTVMADRGSIPINPDVQIFEPQQRAILAWNGHKQMLMLSTDLYASAETQVLEVLPLPSEPQVEKGDIQAFIRANEVINRNLRSTLKLDSRSKSRSEEKPAGKVTLFKEIGPHKISVTQVLKPRGFVLWVEKYLSSLGYSKVSISKHLQKIIDQYIAEGFTWFAFDLIQLDSKRKTLQPIQYTFNTNCLYYPLRITMLEVGQTTIDLIVITPKLLSHFPALPIRRVKLLHTPFAISKTDMNYINRDIAKLFSDREKVYLRIWKLQGALSSFDQDLIAAEKAAHK